MVGTRRSDAGASVGAYLALAALNRVVAPTSKLQFAHWWKTTAADRFTAIPASVLDHRRFWDAMHTITLEQVAQIEHLLALAMIETFGLDISALALDMTNFATYIDTSNDKAPIAQRGKAKQKRSDLRLVGLGLVVTRDGGVPLVSHAYPGNRPDVTQFATMIDLLRARHTALAADTGAPTPAEVTVVFDAGQNSVANFEHLSDTGLAFVGSIPPSDVADLLALPATDRTLVDKARFEALTALEARRVVYGTDRRVILTHSPTLHAAQQVGFAQTLAKAVGKLTELADTLARGKTRRPADKVNAEITAITHDPWLRRVLTCQLTGETPRRTPTDRPDRPERPRRAGSRGVRQTDPGHQPRPLAGRRRGRRLPLPVRRRVQLPPTQRPPRRLVLPQCTTGPSTTSGSTPSPACSPYRSPT